MLTTWMIVGIACAVGFIFVAMIWIVCIMLGKVGY